MDIKYSFQVIDGPTASFEVHLHPDTLEDLKPLPEHPADWTRLEVERCENCPLDPKTSPHCPTAVRLAEVAEVFADLASVDRVRVKVEVSGRTTFKETSMSEALATLIGMRMSTSGCPILARLRPITRVHVPFATEAENQIRALSNYLLAQFLRAREGKVADYSLEGINKVYAEIGMVNRSFSRRLRLASRADANMNALVRLDLLARAVPTLNEFLDTYRLAFAAWE